MPTSIHREPDDRVLQCADRMDGRFALWAGPLAAQVDAALRRFQEDALVASLYSKQASLWSSDPGVQAKIANRLGWLTSPERMVADLPRLQRFADDVRASGITHVVLLGMGGSSLAPEVMRSVMGVEPGWPSFHMLDSTDPASVAAVDRAVDLPHALFVLASKSGGTLEPNSMAAHFRARMEQVGIPRWSDHFVAITDEGTVLHQRAVQQRLRDVFVNPSDIGGRYSALSFFGLVPAVLMGHDAGAIVDWARAMLWLCGPGRSLTTNSAALLGAAMASGAIAGRDKLTLCAPPALSAIGLWVDQLVAESTGKQGRGVVPVAGESIGDVEEYGGDRMLVHLDDARAPDAATRDRLRVLAAAGTPFMQIELPEPGAIGAEFVRWELATAFAGVLLGVNPFDEPNVQQAKDATGRLLDAHKRDGHLARAGSACTVGAQAARLSDRARVCLGERPAAHFLSLLAPGDYFAILAYLGPDPRLVEPLERLRRFVRSRTRCATTFGYGPRYLHSTGQLHKGGPNTGVFLVLSADPAVDLPVPGEAFSFGVLEQAQALGDFSSLETSGRRAMHVHFPRPDPAAIADLCQTLGLSLHKTP